MVQGPKRSPKIMNTHGQFGDFSSKMVSKWDCDKLLEPCPGGAPSGQGSGAQKVAQNNE